MAAWAAREPSGHVHPGPPEGAQLLQPAHTPRAHWYESSSPPPRRPGRYRALGEISPWYFYTDGVRRADRGARHRPAGAHAAKPRRAHLVLLRPRHAGRGLPRLVRRVPRRIRAGRRWSRAGTRSIWSASGPAFRPTAARARSRRRRSRTWRARSSDWRPSSTSIPTGSVPTAGAEPANPSFVPRAPRAYALAFQAGRYLRRRQDLDWIVNAGKRLGLKRMLAGRGQKLPPMTPETRRRLEDAFRPDIRRTLETMLGTSLRSGNERTGAEVVGRAHARSRPRRVDHRGAEGPQLPADLRPLRRGRAPAGPGRCRHVLPGADHHTIAAVLGRVGLDTTLLRFTAANATTGDWVAVKGVYRQALWIATAAAGTATLIVAAGRAVVGREAVRRRRRGRTAAVMSLVGRSPGAADPPWPVAAGAPPHAATRTWSTGSACRSCPCSGSWCWCRAGV